MKLYEPGEFFIDLCLSPTNRELVYLFFPELRRSGGLKRPRRRYGSAAAVLCGGLRCLDILFTTGQPGRCLFLSSNASLTAAGKRLPSSPGISRDFFREALYTLRSAGFITVRKGRHLPQYDRGISSSFTVTWKFRQAVAGFLSIRGSQPGAVRLLLPRTVYPVGEPIKSKGFVMPDSERSRFSPLVRRLRRRFRASVIEMRIPRADWEGDAFPEVLSWTDARGITLTVKKWVWKNNRWLYKEVPVFPEIGMRLHESIGWRCSGIDLLGLFSEDPATGDMVADLAPLLAGLQRIFTNSLERTGRYYALAMLIPSEYRKYILVDGERVVDIDLRACHAVFLYHLWLGVEAPSLLYERVADRLGFSRGNARAARTLVKFGLNMAINAGDESGATGALADKILRVGDEKDWTLHLALRAELRIPDGEPMTLKMAWGIAKRAIEAIKAGLPELAPFLFSGDDLGGKLQHAESEMLGKALGMCLDRGFWVLPFHDGMLIRESDAREAMSILHEAYRAATGFSPAAVTADVHRGDAGLQVVLDEHTRRLAGGEATICAVNNPPCGAESEAAIAP